MKILCKLDDGGSSSVRQGLGRAFAHAGHDFRLWVNSPIHDAFHEFTPDLFIGTTYGLDRATLSVFKEHPATRVALFGSAWGELVDGLDRRKFPIDYVKDEEKVNVEKAVSVLSRPPLVFIHAVPAKVEGVIGGWKSLGCPILSLMNGADALLYHEGAFRPDLACDAALCSGRWPYKAQNLDRTILPLCHLSANIAWKIFSYNPASWPVPQCLGYLEPVDEPDLYASAALSPSVSEPHSTEPTLSYDIIERNFKVPFCGGLLASDMDLTPIFPAHLIPKFSTAKDLSELICHFRRNPADRARRIKESRDIIKRGHLYHDRVATLLEALGYPEEARGVLSKKVEIA